MSKLTRVKWLLGPVLLALLIFKPAAPLGARDLGPTPRAHVAIMQQQDGDPVVQTEPDAVPVPVPEPALVAVDPPSASTEPAPATPPFDLPLIIAEILGWAYSSSALVQLLRMAAAKLDPRLGNGNGAALITLLVTFAGTAYGAMNGALGRAPQGVEDYLSFGSLFLLSMFVAYRTHIGKLLPDPPPAPMLSRA